MDRVIEPVVADDITEAASEDYPDLVSADASREVSMIASGERVGLLDRVASLERSNARLQGWYGAGVVAWGWEWVAFGGWWRIRGLWWLVRYLDGLALVDGAWGGGILDAWRAGKWIGRLWVLLIVVVGLVGVAYGLETGGWDHGGLLVVVVMVGGYGGDGITGVVGLVVSGWVEGVGIGWIGWVDGGCYFWWWECGGGFGRWLVVGGLWCLGLWLGNGWKVVGLVWVRRGCDWSEGGRYGGLVLVGKHVGWCVWMLGGVWHMWWVACCWPGCGSAWCGACVKHSTSKELKESSGLPRWTCFSFIKKMETIFHIRNYPERTIRADAAFAMSWRELIKLMTKNNDLASYTQRFQEITMMCTKMVPEEEDQVEKFIGGLLDNIQGN
ncbi:hypothetical protein Tco_0943556 [Tanacetum coccineum]